jgi:DNA-binding transcriptional ArsR family regulator
VEVFDALAQPKRREILRLLAGRELTAGEIASHFSVTQPAISQHLKILKDVELLNERREGTKRVLSVRAQGFEDLQKFLAELLPGRLERLKELAEEEERDGRDARHAKRN